MNFRVKLYKNTLLLVAGMALSISSLAASKPPSADEMWQIIMQQRELIEKQNERLQKLENQTQENRQAVAENTQAVNATAVAVEEVADNKSSANSWADRTTLGGYAELHYNNLDGSRGASDKDEADLHRFVIFLGHEFNDDIRFFSELEQAFVDFDLSESQTARAGLFLLPIGIINETHEPDTFYGTERNPVEKNIIPATWWEAGGGMHGAISESFSYDAYLHTGLDVNPAKNYAIRSGRQKVSKAKAKDGALTGRIKWNGISGLSLAGSLQYQADVRQSQDPDTVSAWLIEADARYEYGPFGLRALYAHWDLDGDGPKAVGADVQEGFYIEPSWLGQSDLNSSIDYPQQIVIIPACF
ncbi:MAG: porin [gamma proteobacterium symbiont of Bathyaustriella thionipta]|nr:porin [gamma proteobacterium symbiont of Bathyaustriella thionipta]